MHIYNVTPANDIKRYPTMSPNPHGSYTACSHRIDLYARTSPPRRQRMSVASACSACAHKPHLSHSDDAKPCPARASFTRTCAARCLLPACLAGCGTRMRGVWRSASGAAARAAACERKRRVSALANKSSDAGA